MAETETPLSKLQEDVHQALKSWPQADTGTSSLDYLQLFQQARLRGIDNVRQATNEILFEALEALAVDHEEDADLLRKHFLDGLAIHALANRLNVSDATIYRKQQEAIKQLALILQARETQARADYQLSLEKRLKLPPEVELIGVEEELSILLEVLTSPEPAWLVSIEGLGGIGKTALASAVLRRPGLTGRFHDVAWVSAKRQEFLPGIGLEQTGSPALTAGALVDTLLEQFGNGSALAQSPQEKKVALTRLLKKAPYLIVVDNLETAVDYQTLLPVLRELANPGKFLLTSRHSLRAHPEVFCLSLVELDQANTLRFIRHEAKVRGLPLLADAADAELKPIYEVVGGNPLALKLVVGQISILPLSQVLENLKEARGKGIDELYTYIYWQAWHMLDAASQQVLLVMPLAQDGPLDQLRALNQLELDELTQALQQLAALSLVQVGGDLEVRRYTIHRLTETFLLNEAIKWQSSA
jgi:hypothetical protein